MTEKLKIASLGQGQPLVLIHGWGLNSGVWQPLATKLSQHFNVILVDLPGYGINVDIKPDCYDLASIARLIRETVGQKAIYAGWSLGGLVATKIALDAPHQVNALVTIASSPYFVKEENWPGIEPGVLSLFHKQLQGDTKKTIENFLKIQAMGSPHIRQDIRTIRDLVMQHEMPSKDTLEESLSLLETTDLRADLNKVSCRFLRLYGRLDSLVPKNAIAEIDGLAPSSDKVIFTHASHAPFISEFDCFYRELSAWLN